MSAAPKAIVFDLLTALLDSWSLWDSAASPYDGRKWRQRYLEITFGAGAYVPYPDLVRRAAIDAGLPLSAPETLLRDWGKLQSWPEAHTVLQKLKQRGYKLGVVTNCSRDLGHAAASIFGDVFDAVVTAEESGFYKPQPAAYSAILRAMGVAADETLFVAGSAGDVQGATAAGMRVVWHNRVRLPPKGDAVPLHEDTSLDKVLQMYM